MEWEGRDEDAAETLERKEKGKEGKEEEGEKKNGKEWEERVMGRQRNGTGDEMR